MKTILLTLLILTTPFPFYAQSEGLKFNPAKSKIEKQLWDQVNKIIDESELLFRQGEQHLQAKKYVQARAKFDRAIEVILLSGISPRSFSKLNDHYAKLLEKIYQYDVTNATMLGSTETRVGFVEQRYTPSPFDESNSALQLLEKKSLTKITAKEGDTVSTIAALYGLSAIELARYNGVLPNTALAAGREIRVPLRDEGSKPISVNAVTKPSTAATTINLLNRLNKANEEKLLGNKPPQAENGKVQLVVDYFNENMHDPYTMRFIRWSRLEKTYIASEPCWMVKVRLRAKNAFGAYVLGEWTFYIRQNKIIKAQNS